MMSTIDAPAIDAPVRQPRYLELDSLRGLAALTVLLGHLEKMWSETYPPVSAICTWIVALTLQSGAEAVILFFVLSGFVLSLPAVEGRPQSYFTFVTRRVFRIYIPYVAALAASIAASMYLYSRSISSTWVLNYWSGPVQWHVVWQHVMFLRVFNTDRFDPPIWSLVHEMRISLFFPFLCAIVLRFKNRWAFALALTITATSTVMDKLHGVEAATSVADTLHYIPMFILGIYLARERASIAACFSGLSRPARIALGVVGILLFTFAGGQLHLVAGQIMHVGLRVISDWLTALGAGGVIVICLNSPSCKRILHWPPIRLLGQMSYSLYLMHFIVLLCCVDLLFGRIPLPVILSLALVLSIAVSWCSYLWIEKPSMNLGRRLSNAFRNPPGA
jgi:peptidoglycan/LPS O-acetylase OafA/YrhL